MSKKGGICRARDFKGYLPQSYKLPVSSEVQAPESGGVGGAAPRPGWNEFDGLIVAPSGHSCTSQRGPAERGALDEKLPQLPTWE